MMEMSSHRKKNDRYLEVDSNRDLMGIVRGKCNRCNQCPEYLSNVKLYSKKQTDSLTPHPSNDVAIMNCAICGCPSHDHEVDTYGNHLERGTDYFYRRDFDLAIKGYSLASNSPNSALRVKAYSNRAAINLKLENFSAALSDCDQALRIDPANVKVLNRKAHALCALRRKEDGIKIYRLILNKLDADNDVAREALKNLNMPEQAENKVESKETERYVATPVPRPQPIKAPVKIKFKDAWTQTQKTDEHKTIGKKEGKDAWTQTYMHTKSNKEQRNEDVVKQSIDFFDAFQFEQFEEQGTEKEARNRTWAFNDSDNDDIENENDDEGSGDGVSNDDATFIKDQCDLESESWAMKWEEEQNARKTERIKPDIRSKGKNTPDDTIPNFAKISFEELIQVTAAPISVLGDEDINGEKRGKCLNCKTCPHFKRVSKSTSLLSKVSVNKASYDIFLGKLLSAKDGECCANCSCSYEDHEDKGTFNRRVAREKASFERENKELRLKKKKRLEIIQSAKNRMREAKENNITLEKSHICLLTGMRRKHCNECGKCQGFCTFSNPSFFTVDTEMLYCHLCGCEATAHEVDWEAEKEEKSKQERENKWRWEQYERQQKQKQTYLSEEEDDALLNTLELSRQEFRGNMDVLKKQYKRKALACHPDKNTNDRRAGEKFVALTKAYRKLLEKYSPQ